jgi:hypothetical protein
MEHVHHGHVVLESHRFRLLGRRRRPVWLRLAELAGLVVAGGPAVMTLTPVDGIDDRDQGLQRASCSSS